MGEVIEQASFETDNEVVVCTCKGIGQTERADMDRRDHDLPVTGFAVADVGEGIVVWVQVSVREGVRTDKDGLDMILVA